MAEQSSQKKQTVKGSPEAQKKSLIEEKKKETASLEPEMAARRKRRHIRARLQKKEKRKPEEGNEALPSTEKKKTVKKTSKEKTQLPLEPGSESQKAEVQDLAPLPLTESLEDIYPSVQHHTFIGPPPQETNVGNEDLHSTEEAQELKNPDVGNSDPRSVVQPEPEAKKEPAVIEPSLSDIQPSTVQPESEFVSVPPEPQPEPQEVGAGLKPAPTSPEYEAKEPFPELFPSHDVGVDLKPAPTEAEENTAPEIIEQEEFVEESVPINQQEISTQEELSDHAEAAEIQEKSTGGAAKAGVGGSFSAGFKKKFGNGAAFAGAHLRLKYVVLTAVVVFLGFLFASGIAVNIGRSAYGQIMAFFQSKTPPAPVEIRVDEGFLRAWGIRTAYIFAKNSGSLTDVVTPSIKNAFYFGKLAEPAVAGETGITAAYHYGQYKDMLARATLFIEYIHNLRELKSLYDTDVYAMLNQTSQRDSKLADYLGKIKNVRTNSARIIKELGLQIDDLKISFNSLGPDRKNLEQDFFASLEGLAGEKANFLLQSFVDVTQKQTALKARLSALQQILDFYEKAVKKLDIRIEAIEKNYEALLRGIRVVDIPGANLDIIIRQKP